jgi:rhamnulokinase
MSDLNMLAFDLGASSGRAVIGRLDSDVLKLDEIHRFPNNPVAVGDSLYWDALKLFDEMKCGFGKAAKSCARISSVGIDTWGSDFALLGPDDVMLENPHHYRDSRTDGMLEDATRRVSRETIYEETGIQFMSINSLYQLYSLSKRSPWMLDAARTMLLMPDLFNFWFTGIKTSEFTNATTTQCYSPGKGDWARQMLGQLGIPTHFLPPIVQPGTVLGKIKASVGSEIGTCAPLFIAPGTHDTASAVAAVPAENRSWAYISSGTWSLMGVESTSPLISKPALAVNLTNEGGVGNTYRVLKNIMGLWLLQSCQRVWESSGLHHTYPQLMQMASEAEAFRSIIDPDADEFMKPGDMPERIRSFCRRTSQPVPGNEAETVRAILDSLALRYRFVLGQLETLIGERLDPIHIVGGGSKNELMCQLATNTTGRTVVAGPAEATAIGNILAQAMALGHISSIAEARAVVRKSFEVVVYSPEVGCRAEDAYNRFLKLIDDCEGTGS